VREESKWNRLGVKVGERAAKFGREDCRILTAYWREQKRKHGEKGEREILSGKRVCQ
jgi:hypothetical protein